MLSCCVALREARPETCQRNGVAEEREGDRIVSFPCPAKLPLPELSSVCWQSEAVPRGKELGAGSQDGILPANPLAGASMLRLVGRWAC